MKKIALLFLVLLALSVSAAAFAATATIGGEEYNLGEVNSGTGWETFGYGSLNLYKDYAGGSIAFAVDDADDPVILFYGEAGDGEVGTVTVKGSISVTGGFLKIEDFGIGNTLTIDYTGGTKYALDGGANMGLHNGTVKIIAPEGKAYDVEPEKSGTAVLEVVASDVDVAVTATAEDTSKIDLIFLKNGSKNNAATGKFSFELLSGDQTNSELVVHQDKLAYGYGEAESGTAAITRANEMKSGGGTDVPLSGILEKGKTYTLDISTIGNEGDIPRDYSEIRVKFTVGKDEPVDTFTFTAAISTDKSSATVTFRNNGIVCDDLTAPFYYELYKFGSREPVTISALKTGHAYNGVAVCGFGAALADGTYEMEIKSSANNDPALEKFVGKKAAFKVGTTGLPFGDTEISELPDSGATLAATQNPETFDVTLSIVNPNLKDGESVTFHFVENTQSQQGETSARAASRSASAALTLTKKVTAAADKKTFTASAKQEELASLKNGAKYAIEYINGDGSVLGYSTFTQGVLTFKAKSDDPTGSSSGCDAGFGGLLALAALAYFGVRRKEQ